jgi:hypothetical protein
MQFVARPPQGAWFAVELSDAAFAWLVSKGRSPAVDRLDPYQDSAFSGPGLTQLLASVSHAVQEKVAVARERVLATAKLPQAAAARERVLNDLVERALDGDGVAKALRELQTFLELASEASAVVHVDGD